MSAFAAGGQEARQGHHRGTIGAREGHSEGAGGARQGQGPGLSWSRHHRVLLVPGGRFACAVPLPAPLKVR
jgi:hypothetical protein